MSFGNSLNPGCSCCELSVGPPITVKGRFDCDSTPFSLIGPLADGPCFLGTITTRVTHDGADVSTGSTSTTCLGAGTYVFSITSTNPHVVVTPASITVVASGTPSGCESLTYSSPPYFTIHYDYFDPPNTPGSHLGNSYQTICGCPCVLPESVHVEPLNPTYQDATYQAYVSGDCDKAHFSATFAPVGYVSGGYTSQDLTFQVRPGALPTFPITGFGGPFVLPSWGWYSGPFSITQIPDQSCANLVDPCNSCSFPPEPNNCGVFTPDPATVTGWYLLNCTGSGLYLYLIKKIQGQRLICDFYGFHYEPSLFWTVSPIWQWFGGGSSPDSTCDPLFYIDGDTIPHTSASPMMLLTS